MIRNAEIARQSRLAEAVARLQTQVATGQRIARASDDPLAAARIAQLDISRSNFGSWQSNLALANTLATQADDVIANLSQRLTQASETMIAASNGSATASDRATYAATLRGIASDVASLQATRTSLDTPLFASGSPASMRVETDVVIIPVAAAANVFESGGVSLTALLTEAAAALESGDGGRIGASLDVVRGAVGHIADAAADQGVRAARIDTLSERQAVRSVDVAVERSSLADTDLSVAIAELNQRQLTLEAAQAAFARINRRTLFDLLG